MLEIKMSVVGKDIKTFISDLNMTIDQINKDVATAGKATMHWMQVVIDAKKSRSGAQHIDTIPLGDALEQSSDIFYTGNSVFVGIGKIATMNILAKHWNFINSGHTKLKETIPGGGKFVPGYWEGDRFIYSPMCGSGMVVKTPIFGLQGGQPINFIEEGDNFMNKQIQDILIKAKSRLER